MRAVKNAAVILAVCLIVVCGAFMPSIISDMQKSLAVFSNRYTGYGTAV